MIQIKSNQKGLLHNVIYLATHRAPLSTFKQEGKKERNRIEYREVSVFELPLFNLPREWDGIFQSIIRVRRYIDKFNTKKKIWELHTEVSYYGSTCLLEAEKAAQYIRNHWFIENKNHYVRDVSLAEDASRIRKNPGIFARLRSIALNLLRKNQIKNVKEALYKNTLCLENLLKYEGIF